MSEDNTEAASARRLEKAREDGDIAISREFNLVAGLVGGLAVLWVQLGASRQAPLAWFAHALRAETVDFRATAASVLAGALPCALGAALSASLATVLQTGFMIRAAALMPDISRVNPGRGFKRMVSTETLVTAAKSVAKLALLTWVLWSVIHALLPLLALMPARPIAALAPLMQGEIRALVIPLVGAQLLIAGADYGYQRWQHAKKLRMSKQDQKDEHKEQEGNPQMKQRLRQIARLRGKRRMMAAVAKATVVVTNPTHYAVALLYERGSRAAPRVVGKGADEIAARIRELAEVEKIPVVANAPLARALYLVEIDSEIPAEHFKAVAEIVAYIWRLDRGAARGARRRPG